MSRTDGQEALHLLEKYEQTLRAEMPSDTKEIARVKSDVILAIGHLHREMRMLYSVESGESTISLGMLPCLSQETGEAAQSDPQDSCQTIAE